MITYRADAHLPRHHLRHEQMVLDLLLHEEEDGHAERDRRARP